MVALWVILAVLGVGFLVFLLPSIRVIGATEVGLVSKRFGGKLEGSNPVAFKGEAGYQADLLMPGWRIKFWIVYSVQKHPWVQVPAGEIGVVIAQVGEQLPIGAKSAIYRKELGEFRSIRTFVEQGGQKGIQRPALPPGSLIPVHPVGFLVLTKSRVYGVPVSPEHVKYADAHNGMLDTEAFGLDPEKFTLTIIKPRASQKIEIAEVSDEQLHEKVAAAGKGKTLAREGERLADRILRERKSIMDVVGIITTLEGEPLPPGDIASRLGGFEDIKEAEEKNAGDQEVIELILKNKNDKHNNYQDFQAFMDNGGKIGLQHDPLLYGAYVLNPFLVRVEIVPMLVVEQGEVGVIKAYVGQPGGLISKEGTEVGKFGNLVKPGHRGIWSTALGTGKYPLNPHCYNAEIVPVSILTLNWSEHQSPAHFLDTNLQPIQAKSREGFIFKIDLQVQIHISRENAPKVIAMVGTMQNLVLEVLQAAVGNHFRDKLQGMPAVSFIETRQTVQGEAMAHVTKQLNSYWVETVGVLIQDVVFPEKLVTVLTEREVANQEVETWKKKTEAQKQRIDTEKQTGLADRQKELASSEVDIKIKENKAEARKKEAAGEAYYIAETGKAQGAEVLAVGMAKAQAYEAQVKAMGQEIAGMVNVVNYLADKNLKFVPDVMVSGGGNSMDGLAGYLMRWLGKRGSPEPKEEK